MILNNLFRRYFSTEYLARYGSLATYYPEYAASAHATAGYISNGYFEVASPRSLTALPYDAASQFNRYFDAEKVDCKYNPNSESPKTEFPQQPNPHAGQPGQHPNSGKDNNNAPNSTVPGSGLEVVGGFVGGPLGVSGGRDGLLLLGPPVPSLPLPDWTDTP